MAIDSRGKVITRRQCLAGCSALVFAALAGAHTRPSRSALELRVATALELSTGLRAGRWNSQEITEYYFERIAAVNGPLERFDNNGALNAFIRTYPEIARCAYEQADRARSYSGWSGIPVALKDVFAVAELPVTVGTPALRGYRAPDDCTLWKKWSSNGAVLLGHTQSQRFIGGVTTPQTANPWNPRLIAGGSSGGSAAAVAAGLVPVALGTETDGSLIYPALCCAVTTLKPSLGLLSLSGVYPASKSLDVAGPLARSAADCAWVIATLAGRDPADSATAEQKGHTMDWPVADESASAQDRPFAGLRFLVSTNEHYTNEIAQSAQEDSSPPVEVDPRIQGAFEDFQRSLTTLGAQIVHAEIPEELGSNGLFNSPDARFGNRSARKLLVTADMVSTTLPTRHRWFEHASADEWALAVEWYKGTDQSLESEEVRANAALLNPATLAMAMAERQDLRSGWESVLSRHRCDAHIYLEVGSPLPVRRGIDDTPPPRATRSGVRPNDLGWPVLSMPVAMANGLEVPISVQIMAPRWHDHRLLHWGIVWQHRNPEFVLRAPPDTIKRTAT